MTLPRIIHPDKQVWVAMPQDELDALELGWRVTNAMIADNDPDPSVGFPTLLEIEYIMEHERTRSA